MDEEWAEIDGFPDYVVNRDGKIYNKRQERDIQQFYNQRGHAMVGLYLGDRQYTKSVARIVADAFLPEPSRAYFDTLIHVDGNFGNSSVDNLRWRPRHIAILYHKQFENLKKYGKLHPNGLDVPIYDENSNKDYKNTMDAALQEALLEGDVVLSVLNNIPCRPFGHRFYYA